VIGDDHITADPATFVASFKNFLLPKWFILSIFYEADIDKFVNWGGIRNEVLAKP
jgi:hypothetical protein